MVAGGGLTVVAELFRLLPVVSVGEASSGLIRGIGDDIEMDSGGPVATVLLLERGTLLRAINGVDVDPDWLRVLVP